MKEKPKLRLVVDNNEAVPRLIMVRKSLQTIWGLLDLAQKVNAQTKDNLNIAALIVKRAEVIDEDLTHAKQRVEKLIKTFQEF